MGSINCLKRTIRDPLTGNASDGKDAYLETIKPSSPVKTGSARF